MSLFLDAMVCLPVGTATQLVSSKVCKIGTIVPRALSVHIIALLIYWNQVPLLNSYRSYLINVHYEGRQGCFFLYHH